MDALTSRHKKIRRTDLDKQPEDVERILPVYIKCQKPIDEETLSHVLFGQEKWLIMYVIGG